MLAIVIYATQINLIDYFSFTVSVFNKLIKD